MSKMPMNVARKVTPNHTDETKEVKPVVVEPTKSEHVEVKVPEAKYDPSELAKHTTKSAKIRYLHSRGMSRGEIAKELSRVYGKTVLYQHVRNVLIVPVKQPRAE